MKYLKAIPKKVDCYLSKETIDKRNAMGRNRNNTMKVRKTDQKIAFEAAPKVDTGMRSSSISKANTSKVLSPGPKGE